MLKILIDPHLFVGALFLLLSVTKGSIRAKGYKFPGVIDTWRLVLGFIGAFLIIVSVWLAFFGKVTKTYSYNYIYNIGTEGKK